MNKVLLLGRLTDDADVREFGKGKDKTLICNFTIAIYDGKNEDGEDKTQFIDCSAFGKTCEILESYTKKGSKIALEGKLVKNIYEDKEGITRYQTKVNVSNVHLCEPISNPDEEYEQPKRKKVYTRKSK